MRLNESRWQEPPDEPSPRDRSSLVTGTDEESARLKTLVRSIDDTCGEIAQLKLRRNDLDFELRQARVVYFQKVGDRYIQKMRGDLEYKMLRANLELILTTDLTAEQIKARLEQRFEKEIAELDAASSEQGRIFEEREK